MAIVKDRTVYISGPMTGIRKYNREAFNNAEKMLKKMNIKCINPRRLFGQKRFENADWIDFMVQDVKDIVKCDTIMLLPGWKKSRGVVIELTIANALKFDIWYLRDDIISTK